MSMRHVAALVVAVMVASQAVGCGGGNDPSGSLPSLDILVGDLDGLLRQSIVDIGLDPDVGRRELVDEACIGPGDGKNLRYYFDEPSHDRGAMLLRRLKDHWSEAPYELNEPGAFQDDDELVTLLAGTELFNLEGWWFPGSKELAIGGSTPCV